MKVLRNAKNWLFYGHIWIALAAAGLSWMSITLCFEPSQLQYIPTWRVLTAIFFATLGVYTVHRILSYRKIGHQPPLQRYNLVAKQPGFSVVIGLASLTLATVLLLPSIGFTWPAVAFALPPTAFYLIPPVPGVRRLRDLPFIKTALVGFAWALITHMLPLMLMQWEVSRFPLELQGDISPSPYFKLEFLNRFLLLMSVALLFDVRDAEVDAEQGVKTFANTHQKTLPIIVYAALLICAYAATNVPISDTHNALLPITLPLAYSVALVIAYQTFRKKDEDWYAIAVDGILLLPPLVVVSHSVYP